MRAPKVVADPSPERTESESVRDALVPVGALEDARLALEPEAVRLLDVLAARGEDVEDEAAARLEQAARRAQRAELLGLGLHVQERAERADDERDALGDGRLAEVADAEVEPSSATPASSAAARATASIPGDESTPITSIPARAIGTAIRPVPTASSTTGPPDASACST